MVEEFWFEKQESSSDVILVAAAAVRHNERLGEFTF